MLIRKKKIVGIVAALVTAAMLAACGGNGDNGGAVDPPPVNGATEDPVEPDPGPAETGNEPYGHLRIGSMSIPPSWNHDGVRLGHDVTILTAVFDTVLRWNPDGSPAPGIAESWDISEDRLTITLTIRDGVSFTDGTPLDADAVAANLNEFRASSSPALATAAEIADVVADGNTVVITLNNPDPGLLHNLASALGVLMSPATFGTDAAASHPIGSGPYIFDAAAATPGHEYSFTANPDWWDADNTDRFERVTLTFFEDATALANAIIGGQIDVSNVWGDQGVVPQLVNAGMNTNYILIDWFGLVLIDRDGVTSPALGDVRVRQAINYAIDREGILNVFNHGRGEVTNQIFGPATPGFVTAILDRYPFDPERAAELVAEADAEGATITMIISPAVDAGLADTLVQQIEATGLVVDRTAAAPGQLFTDIQTGRYSMFPMWLANTSVWQQVQYSVLTTGLFNPFDSTDPEVEAYLDTFRHGTDAESTAAAAALSTWFVENAWFAPIYNSRATAVNADWVNFTSLSTNIMPPIYMIQPAR